MKQLRYLLRDRSFVTFVIGGVLLLILSASVVYLVKQQSSLSDLVTRSDQTGELVQEDQSTEDGEAQKQTVAAEDVVQPADEENTDNEVAIAVQELPQTGGQTWWGIWGLMLVVYVLCYGGRLILMRIMS